MAWIYLDNLGRWGQISGTPHEGMGPFQGGSRVALWKGWAHARVHQGCPCGRGRPIPGLILPVPVQGMGLSQVEWKGGRAPFFRELPYTGAGQVTP